MYLEMFRIFCSIYDINRIYLFICFCFALNPDIYNHLTYVETSTKFNIFTWISEAGLVTLRV
jgi:hypothetical protein